MLTDVVTDGTSRAKLEFVNTSGVDSTTNGLMYLKSNPSTDMDVSVLVGNYTTLGDEGWVQFDGVRLYEIDQSTYDAIGVSLTDSDVERLFPYVDSVQHVENPVLSVEGDNLLPPFTQWDLHDNATVISPYELELNATGLNQVSAYNTNVLPNQNYVFNQEDGAELDVKFMDENNNTISYLGEVDTFPKTFTTPTNCNSIRLYLTNYVSSTGTFTFTNPILNLGTEPKPFVERNPSYLYASVTLAGNENKKDISYQSDGTWYVDRNFEPKRKLSGLDEWLFGVNSTGYKQVDLQLSNTVADSEVVVKHDGSIIKHSYPINGADQSYLDGGSKLRISIDDSDSGWNANWSGGDYTDSTLSRTMTASEAIKAYFNGWKWDDTNKNLYSRYDPSVTSTDVDEVITRNLHEENNNKNYFLSYQLAYRIAIDEELFDTSANYTVTYEILDKYDFTTNNNDVTVHYANSLKSAFEQVVSKQSDQGTQISIHASQIIDILARLEAGGL